MLTTPSKPLFLDSVVADKERHARFLNALSLLEHIGSRKILLTQPDALQHLAEETRHAHFFRRAAEKEAGRPLEWTDADAAAPAACKMYFGRLDAAVTAEVGEGPLAYLYVTQTIELRALSLYEAHEASLRAAGHWLTLKSVLAEEKGHLAEMDADLRRNDPRYEERRAKFAAAESALYARWLSAVEAALG